jgi:hypothetical protein
VFVYLLYVLACMSLTMAAVVNFTVVAHIGARRARGYVRCAMALCSSQISRVSDALARSRYLASTANW